MKFIFKGILLMFFGLLFFLQAGAQPAKSVSHDSIIALDQDTVIEIEKDSTKQHLPARATMFSAVLPGLGQIYNKKYWKLPIVYGGFIGLGYAINYYNSYYLGLKKAYYDLNDSNPETNSFKNFSDKFDVENSTISTLNTQLTLNIEEYRRNRDLLIIITAGFYLLNVLDANVDAHFINFDISEDLTFNMEPVFIDHFSSSPVLGAHISFTF